MAGAVLERSTHARTSRSRRDRRRQVDRLFGSRGALLARQPRGSGCGRPRPTRSWTKLVYHELPQLNAALGGGCATSRSRATSTTPACANSSATRPSWANRAPMRTSSPRSHRCWRGRRSRAGADLDAINLHWPGASCARRIAASHADCTHKRCRFFPQLRSSHGVHQPSTPAPTDRRHQPRGLSRDSL